MAFKYINVNLNSLNEIQILQLQRIVHLDLLDLDISVRRELPDIHCSFDNYKEYKIIVRKRLNKFETKITKYINTKSIKSSHIFIDGDVIIYD